MTEKEFETLVVGDRVRLGGRKGTVRSMYKRWHKAVFVEFDNGKAENIEYEFLDLIERPVKAKAVTYAEALKGVNDYRRRKGRKALDQVAAGWGSDDVIAEYERLVAEGSIPRS